jgi:hypothetical protein
MRCGLVVMHSLRLPKPRMSFLLALLSSRETYPFQSL